MNDYANGYVYNMNFGDALPGLSYFSFSEGRVLNSGSSYEYEYHVKDHLGNVRLTFKSNGTTIPEVLEKNFYYPFGMTVTTNIVGDENKYKYNGKEYENEHGLNWYHYGARFYDPALARWHTMDPVDEFLSPYLYVGNNPILFIDPDGRQADFGGSLGINIMESIASYAAEFDFTSWFTDEVGIAEELTSIENMVENSAVLEQAKQMELNVNTDAIPEYIYLSVAVGKQSMKGDRGEHGGFALTKSGIYTFVGPDYSLSLGTLPTSGSLSGGFTSTSSLSGASVFGTVGYKGIGLEIAVGTDFAGNPAISAGLVFSSEKWWAGIGESTYFPIIE